MVAKRRIWNSYWDRGEYQLWTTETKIEMTGGIPFALRKVPERGNIGRVPNVTTYRKWKK